MLGGGSLRGKMSTIQPDRSSPTEDWHNRHLWQIQPVRDVLLVLLILVLIYLGYVLSIVTVPLLLALGLAYLFQPVIGLLSRLKWVSREGAVGGIIVGVVVTIAVPVTLVATFGLANGYDFGKRLTVNTVHYVQFVDGFEREAVGAVDVAPGELGELTAPVAQSFEVQLAQQGAEVRGIYDEMPNESWKRLAAFSVTNYELVDEALGLIRSWVPENAQSIAQRTFGGGAGALRAVLSAVTSVGVVGFMVFLTLFFFFFIATAWASVVEFGRSLIPDASRERTLDLLGKMDAVIAAFVRGRLTIALIQSVIFSILYWFIGVPTPILLGFAVGFLSIVPYLALIAVPISIGMLWLDGPGGFRGEIWWIVGAPVAVYFIGQAVDDYILTPIIQGKSTGMDTPTILFATMAGGTLGGIYGLLLAIPVAACIKILLKELYWPRFKAWAEGRAADPLPIGDD